MAKNGLKKYMDLENTTIHTVNHEPINTGKVKPMPPHSDPSAGFMGENMGVNGRMGDYSSPLAKEE